MNLRRRIFRLRNAYSKSPEARFARSLFYAHRSLSNIRWMRLDDEPFEYAAQWRDGGYKYLTMMDGSPLRRELV